MEQVISTVMVYIASALMTYNIYKYVRFSQNIREHGRWEHEQKLFNIPIFLLITFLIGYLAVALFGSPDLVISGILFGGSIFVLLMLIFIQRAFEKIQENERLEAKLIAAEEASKAKTLFLSNMSHDIRTPLNAIIGYTTLAKGEHVSQEETLSYIGKIEKASYQLLDIVDDVLEMSRIESGKIELEPQRMNLEECMREAEDLVKNQLASKDIQFSLSSNVIHPWVLCDKNRLNRVLMNLLCNAGKFTQSGGSVSLQLEELSSDGNTGDYRITVKDTGIGMDPDFVEHLFTPFEREKTSTVSGIQGTGLGMAITKNIVDMMGGTIEVHTQKNKGTSFIIDVSFPLEEADENQMTDARKPVSFEGKRALLVEDNPVNVEIAQMLLTQAGFNIETAENGERAVEKVSGSEPGYYDVVLMDIQMPVMDGYSAAKAIRALSDPARAGVPIIAMTANAFKEDVEKAQDAGMNSHIAKPLDVNMMMTTIASVLNS